MNPFRSLSDVFLHLVVNVTQADVFHNVFLNDYSESELFNLWLPLVSYGGLP